LGETNYTLNNGKPPFALSFIEVTSPKFFLRTMVVLKVTNDKALCLVAAKKEGREKDPSKWPAEYEPDDGASRRGDARKHHQ
jgi:hypothetical protein